jgi:hypothetical protein
MAPSLDGTRRASRIASPSASTSCALGDQVSAPALHFRMPQMRHARIEERLQVLVMRPLVLGCCRTQSAHLGVTHSCASYLAVPSQTYLGLSRDMSKPRGSNQAKIPRTLHEARLRRLLRLVLIVQRHDAPCWRRVVQHLMHKVFHRLLCASGSALARVRTPARTFSIRCFSAFGMPSCGVISPTKSTAGQRGFSGGKRAGSVPCASARSCTTASITHLATSSALSAVQSASTAMRCMWSEMLHNSHQNYMPARPAAVRSVPLRRCDLRIGVNGTPPAYRADLRHRRPSPYASPSTCELSPTVRIGVSATARLESLENVEEREPVGPLAALRAVERRERPRRPGRFWCRRMLHC